MEKRISTPTSYPSQRSTRKKLRILVFSSLGMIVIAFLIVLTSTRNFLVPADPGAQSVVTTLACMIGLVSSLMVIALVIRTKRERDATEIMLLENQERYRSVISASNTGVWEYHTDTQYLWCSDEYFEMLGYDAKVFQKSHPINKMELWDNLLHADDKQLAQQHFADYLAKGSTHMYENYFRMKHKNGDWVWIWSRGKTLRKPDGRLSNITVGTHINITEKKVLEIDLLRHNEKLLKYAFLNAHEVRGPVARLLGLIEVSKLEKELDYPWFFEKVKQEAVDIDTVLNEIMRELNEGEERNVVK